MGDAMMINLDIKDINVKMELNGVFWNEDRIAEMMVTTTAEHSLILHILVDLENKTICAMSATIVNGFCPLCKQKRDECSELNDLQNKMDILEEAYDWVREHPEYRFQLSFYEYNKFEVVK
ncbi:hypothetical protein COF68_12460 [Bacillus toyonensis]|uniref:Group-specific protein n=2 Tax=Bacillaceae TaxID=186817 RepID=A0AB36T153_9BACI|nr:hypothetical protein [Bacillus toyonensis biovar Thuringiensis]PDY53138.1 hypothetical protein CON61_11585 [Bacillus toyonensis]PDZ84724.1 hypothetical protein CON93_13875 [Bacillus toyonensis]PEA72026.1 hypothetical protein COO00_13805 [Bacillus toyonensis]PEC11633.1 hypothetical protein CON55_06705 [Bacillus toyonensis]